MLGVTLPLLPVFSIGDGSQEGGFGEALVPDQDRQQQRARTRFSLLLVDRSQSRSHDHATHLYRRAAGAGGRWRHLTSIGAYQLSGIRTHGDIPDPDAIDLTPEDRGASVAISRAMADFNSTRIGPSPVPSGRQPTRRLRASMTSPATTGCAVSSTPSASTSTAMSRSKDGHFRA